MHAPRARFHSTADAGYRGRVLALSVRMLGSMFMLISVGCSIAAQIMYLRRPGAQWVGFGFARFYYGELRREKPLVFFGSIGGIGVAILLFVASGFLART